VSFRDNTLEIHIVLVEPEHEGNIGLIARIMKNFGYKNLWLVNPKTTLGPEARALASHAQELLTNAKIVKKLDQPLRNCDYSVATTAIIGKKSSNLNRKSLTLREFAQRVKIIEGQIAIIFGRESRGLTNKEITGCDFVMTIPTKSEYKTLNIATAVSITLYELTAHNMNFSHFERADKETRLRLVNKFEDLSKKVSIPTYKIPLARTALSNVISRGLISTREASLMTGVFRRAIDRIDNNN
jgi:TrmH family RNA methyltransferase